MGADPQQTSHPGKGPNPDEDPNPDEGPNPEGPTELVETDSGELVERLSTPRNASAAQAINSALSSGVLSGLATMASGWLFDHAGAHGYLLMSAMSAAGLLGALRLYGVRRLDP